MEEIKVDLDRRVVKKKEKRESGFPSLSAPNQKEEKMLGVLGWVGSLRLKKQGYDHFLSCQRNSISSMTEISRQLFDGTTMEAV